MHAENKANGIIRPRIHVDKPGVYALGNVVVSVFPSDASAQDSVADINAAVELAVEAGDAVTDEVTAEDTEAASAAVQNQGGTPYKDQFPPVEQSKTAGPPLGGDDEFADQDSGYAGANA